MRKRSFCWRVLLVVIIGISLGGCASIERLCGHEAEKEQVMAQRQPEAVQPAPQRPPEPAKPVPPKKDRN